MGDLVKGRATSAMHIVSCVFIYYSNLPEATSHALGSSRNLVVTRSPTKKAFLIRGIIAVQHHSSACCRSNIFESFLQTKVRTNHDRSCADSRSMISPNQGKLLQQCLQWTPCVPASSSIAPLGLIGIPRIVRRIRL